MHPKNLPLFYAGLVIGLLGSWLFAFTIYWVSTDAQGASYCCGANIGAGLAGMLSWLLGVLSAILLILSYVIKPDKK